MRVKLEFELRFQSDWHINAGFGEEGKADAVLERTPENRPVISGTTLKGIFRDALHDLERNRNQTDSETAKRIVGGWMGKAGEDSRWRFSAATYARSVHSEVRMLATGVRVDPRFRRAEENKLFIREMGPAETYTFVVEGMVTEETWTEDVSQLVAAAAYIQRLGARRRRGGGQCEISLMNPELHRSLLQYYIESMQNKPVTPIPPLLLESIISPEQQYQSTLVAGRYRLLLYTERPLVLAMKPEAGNVFQGMTFIPGQALRGAFAERARPGELGDNSDAYQQFLDFYLKGNLRFSHLSPMKTWVDADNKKLGRGVPTMPTPLGLQRGEDSTLFTSAFAGITKQKAFKDKWLLQSNDAFQQDVIEFGMTSHTHVAIDPDLKRASDGDLYSYEAIPAGQTYIGELLLTQDMPAWLLDAVPDEVFTLYLGKGRNRSYGQCSVVLQQIEDEVAPFPWMHLPLEQRLQQATLPPNELLMTLASDTILMDTWGAYYERFDPAWLEAVLECRATIPESSDSHAQAIQVVQSRIIESFDARSGLPRWRDRALAAGSTVRLRFPDGLPSLDTLRRIEREGIGLRRSEGYGRVVFNHPAHTVWAGFAPMLNLPEGFFQKGIRRTLDQRFQRNWEGLIQDQIGQLKLEEPIGRALAHRLVALSGLPIETVVAELQKPPLTMPTERQSYKQYKRLLQQVMPLLEKLIQDQVALRYTRPGLVRLAEWLLNHAEITNA